MAYSFVSKIKDINGLSHTQICSQKEVSNKRTLLDLIQISYKKRSAFSMVLHRTQKTPKDFSFLMPIFTRKRLKSSKFLF